MNPELIFCHKDLDMAALVGDAPGAARALRRWSADGSADPQDEFFADAAAGPTPREMPERNNAEDIACIFCTSGTTARPKIVVYDHCRLLAQRARPRWNSSGLTEDDRTLEYRSFGWNSAQVLSLMPFLQKGLTMHIAKRFSHSRFFEWMQTHGITFSAGVPTVLNMLLNKPLGYTAKDVPTLRLMTLQHRAAHRAAVDAVRGDVRRQAAAAATACRRAGWVCGNRTYKNKMGTVGVPALHQELRSWTATGKAVPGRASRARSPPAVRTRRSDICSTTARSSRCAGKRIKTGDLGIMDAEGFVRVSGRTKDLIIRGGVNIAPLEIDEILLKHPGHSRRRGGRRAGQDLWRGGRVLRRDQGPRADRGERAAALRGSICRPPRCRSRS